MEPYTKLNTTWFNRGRLSLAKEVFLIFIFLCNFEIYLGIQVNGDRRTEVALRPATGFRYALYWQSYVGPPHAGEGLRAVLLSH